MSRSPALIAAQSRYRHSAKGRAARRRVDDRLAERQRAEDAALLSWINAYRLRLGEWPTRDMKDAWRASYRAAAQPQPEKQS